MTIQEVAATLRCGRTCVYALLGAGYSFEASATGELESIESTDSTTAIGYIGGQTDVATPCSGG